MTDSIIIKRRLAGSLGGKIRAELARLRMSSKRSIDDFRAQLRNFDLPVSPINLSDIMIRPVGYNGRYRLFYYHKRKQLSFIGSYSDTEIKAGRMEMMTEINLEIGRRIIRGHWV